MHSSEVMNAMDVARYLGLGKNTVYQLAKTGVLASYRVGRKLRFTLDDVEAYVASTHQGVSVDAVPAYSSADTLADQNSDNLSEAASFGELQGTRLVLAGEDPAADVICGSLAAYGMSADRTARGGYTALVNLYAGDADMALVSLYDQKANSYNLPFIRNLAPGASLIVFRLYSRRVGFIVAEGNPKRLTSWGALLREGVRLANRTKGCAARVLLDEKLCALEARSEFVSGYETQAFVASSTVGKVASGMADVAIGSKRDAESSKGVEFVPLQEEWVDLVVAKSKKTRELIRTLKNMFSEGRFDREFAVLGAENLSKLGTIIYES